MPHLGYFGVKALAHLNPSMRDQDSAICVDVHQGPSLVQELGGEGDAKLGGNDGQAPLAPPVGLVELITCLLPLGKTCLVDGAIPASLRTKYNFRLAARSTLRWQQRERNTSHSLI